MNLFRSILLLLSLCLFIMLPYSIGFGLATGSTKAYILGLVCGAVSVGLFLVQGKPSRESH